jgi:hypothetical protein
MGEELECGDATIASGGVTDGSDVDNRDSGNELSTKSFANTIVGLEEFLAVKVEMVGFCDLGGQWHHLDEQAVLEDFLRQRMGHHGTMCAQGWTCDEQGCYLKINMGEEQGILRPSQVYLYMTLCHSRQKTLCHTGLNTLCHTP